LRYFKLWPKEFDQIEMLIHHIDLFELGKEEEEEENK